MKSIEYKDAMVFYRTDGMPDGPSMLFLHGWGGDQNSFAPIQPYFLQKYNCIFVRFPCFSIDDPNSPKVPFDLVDYANIVFEILDKEGVGYTDIIAHSFGARVSVLLVNANPSRFGKLILTGAAGIPKRRGFWLRLRVWFYKFRRKVFKINPANRGSSDYRKLTLEGKITFQNIIRSDLRAQISQIQNKTLLVYGRKDRATPVKIAKVWTKLGHHTKLIIYENCGHFCFLDQPSRFIIDTKTHLGQEKN